MNLPGLNEKQKEAAEHPGSHLLIVAGAGSGKTRTLTNRLFQLLKKGAAAENIIAITFTNKAADEMRERVEKLLGISLKAKSGVFGAPFIGTFHSLGARILKKEAKFLGRNSNYTIYDEDDAMRLVKKIAKDFNLDSKKYPPAQLRYRFSSMKNELRPAEIRPEEASAFDLTIQAAFGEYEAQLVKNNAFDFDDLIEKPVRVFQSEPAILEKYQKQFRHILVDEYQDINTSQYEFIRLLVGQKNHLSVVGDDQQSIYKFRHSDFRNFLNFERDWPEAKVILLEQNYRSTSNIIKAASSVIANNKFQRPKNLWTENEDGEPVKVIEHGNHFDEADFVATLIKSKLAFSAAGAAAVLYRTNAQSRAIEQALLEREIPYRIFGGVRFYERKEIKDMLAALRYAFNPQDSVSLERLDKNFYKKIYLKLKEELPLKAKELSPAELLAYVVKTSDFLEQLRKNFVNFKERRENVEELISFASGFNSLADFLEKASLLGPLDAGEGKPKVSLMTIHLSKGLEFEDVFLVGANEGLLPHQMSYGGEEEIEEERRLMYVAMTRAMKNLYLNFYNLPSRFLSEIAPETIEYLSGGRSLDDEERYIEY